MELNAIGFDYNWIDGTSKIEARRRGIKKDKVEAEQEQSRPKDNGTSMVNKDKGRIIDVSF